MKDSTLIIERDNSIFFSEGYKYQLRKRFHITTVIKPIKPFRINFLEMDEHGNLWIDNGYAWNGASGPTWDTLSSMIGSLVHDAFYQLIRLGLVDFGYRDLADKILHDLCTQDGMIELRADYWEWAVVHFGAGSCRPSAEPKILVAP